MQEPDIGQHIRAADHFVAAAACFQASQAAFREGDGERAALYYRIGITFGSLGEMCLQVEKDERNEEGER